MYCNLETLGCDRMARRPLREPPTSDESIPDDLRIVFGQNLRAARIKAGLTQAQLAERTGLTQQYVSWVEAGRANITLATMTTLARVVREDVRELLRKRPGRTPPPS
jgi:DNA-binding XRE family transcriptional regulator